MILWGLQSLRPAASGKRTNNLFSSSSLVGHRTFFFFFFGNDSHKKTFKKKTTRHSEEGDIVSRVSCTQDRSCARDNREQGSLGNTLVCGKNCIQSCRNNNVKI